MPGKRKRKMPGKRKVKDKDDHGLRVRRCTTKRKNNDENDDDERRTSTVGNAGPADGTNAPHDVDEAMNINDDDDGYDDDGPDDDTEEEDIETIFPEGGRNQMIRAEDRKRYDEGKRERKEKEKKDKLEQVQQEIATREKRKKTYLLSMRNVKSG
jgi:hypothetical protein